MSPVLGFVVSAAVPIPQTGSRLPSVKTRVSRNSSGLIPLVQLVLGRAPLR